MREINGDILKAKLFQLQRKRIGDKSVGMKAPSKIKTSKIKRSSVGK